MGKRSALTESGFGLGGLRCSLMNMFYVIFVKRGKINLMKNIPWILLMCFLEDINSGTMLTTKAESSKILCSCALPPHHPLLSLTLEILMQPSEH